jgi:hypothetical protein
MVSMKNQAMSGGSAPAGIGSVRGPGVQDTKGASMPDGAIGQMRDLPEVDPALYDDGRDQHRS